jgi:hypothetical protein
VGGVEDFLPGKLEPSVRDHSGKARILMAILESGRLTVSDGQFLWGGDLKSGLVDRNVNYELGNMLEHLY